MLGKRIKFSVNILFWGFEFFMLMTHLDEIKGSIFPLMPPLTSCSLFNILLNIRLHTVYAVKLNCMIPRNNI